MLLKLKRRFVLEPSLLRLMEEKKGSFYRFAYTILKSYLDSLENKELCHHWFIKILRNECFKLHKKKEFTLSLNESIPKENLSESMFDLKHALHELSYEEKEVITLKYIEGYKLKEISGILDIPIGTVKSRLFYAVKNLKYLYRKES